MDFAESSMFFISKTVSNISVHEMKFNMQGIHLTPRIPEFKMRTSPLFAEAKRMKTGLLKIQTLPIRWLMILSVSAVLLSCGSQETASDEIAVLKGPAMTIEKTPFGKLPDGKEIELYTLSNSRGMEAGIMTYGATLVFLKVPDREDNIADIVLGYDSLDGYLEDSPYFGAIVGRYANRIADGLFTLDGKEYKLAANDGENHLHGGIRGFDKVVWNAETVKNPDAAGVKFLYLSPDGEEGYPGNLDCRVTYWLTENNELKLEYHAETSKPTPVNLTHHSYFNLKGQGNGDILGHELMLNADKYTPVNEQLIPTGEIKPVEGTPFDFTHPHAVGEYIQQVPGGYDHNFVLNSGGARLALAARVYEPENGRVMEIHTTEPGIQFYSGNFLDGSITGKSGKVYYQHYGFCLEAQHFPDSPNHPNFPSAILRPGEIYAQTTIHKFSTKQNESP